MKKVEELRAASFRHEIRSPKIGGGQHYKFQILRMAQVQGVLGILLLLWTLLMLGQVMVEPSEHQRLQRSCGGLHIAALLLLKVTSTIVLVSFVIYRKAEWDASDWTMHENPTCFFTLAAIDAFMVMWSLGGCICQIKHAAPPFLVFSLITVVIQLLVAVRQLGGLYDLMRFCQSNDNQSQVPSADDSDSGVDMRPISSVIPEGPESESEEEDLVPKTSNPAVPQTSRFPQSLRFQPTGSPLAQSTARTPKVPQSLRFQPTGSPLAQSTARTPKVQIFGPDMFAQLWGEMPESGSFKCTIGIVPRIEELTRHLQARGFTVVAHGVLKDCTKVYFHCCDFVPAGTDPDTKFLCEFKFWHTKSILNAVFKCSSARAEPFVQMFELNHLVSIQ